jgi:transposase-like protein
MKTRYEVFMNDSKQPVILVVDDTPDNLQFINGILCDHYTVKVANNGEKALRIARSWRNNWERIIPLFSYPTEIRKAIYSTNAIESLNMSLRKVTKNRGHFPNDEAMFKLLYLALKNIAKKWTMPIRDWKSALNQFSIIFDGRMPVI